MISPRNSIMTWLPLPLTVIILELYWYGTAYLLWSNLTSEKSSALIWSVFDVPYRYGGKGIQWSLQFSAISPTVRSFPGILWFLYTAQYSRSFSFSSSMVDMLGVVWKIAMFGKMHRNYCMLGENPQAGCRLTRIFDDTDSDLWAF